MQPYDPSDKHDFFVAEFPESFRRRAEALFDDAVASKVAEQKNGKKRQQPTPAPRPLSTSANCRLVGSVRKILLESAERERDRASQAAYERMVDS